MTRPFTDEERADIAEVCALLAQEHGVRVRHRFPTPDDVWFTVQDGGRTSATGLSTGLVDGAPSFVNTRFATCLTLTRLLRRSP